MKNFNLDPETEARLTQLKVDYGNKASKEEITEIVTTIISTMQGELNSNDIKIYNELENLITFIKVAKAEIAALKPELINSSFIPSATNELDAVVSSTEEATSAILDSVETIESISSQVDPKIQETIMLAVTKIYEACNFQDITGQRIKKVVKTLMTIEDRIEELIHMFGEGFKKVKSLEEEEIDPRTLLNGPQLPGQAQDQNSIDALFDDL